MPKSAIAPPKHTCLDCDDPIDLDDTSDPLFCSHCASFRAWYFGDDQ